MTPAKCTKYIRHQYLDKVIPRVVELKSDDIEFHLERLHTKRDLFYSVWISYVPISAEVHGLLTANTVADQHTSEDISKFVDESYNDFDGEPDDSDNVLLMQTWMRIFTKILIILVIIHALDLLLYCCVVHGVFK